MKEGDIKWRWLPYDDVPVKCEVIKYVDYIKDINKGTQTRVRSLHNRDLKTGDTDLSLNDRCDQFYDTEEECLEETYKYYKYVYGNEVFANRIVSYKRYKKLLEYDN
jgi:hypothetical protein